MWGNHTLRTSGVETTFLLAQFQALPAGGAQLASHHKAWHRSVQENSVTQVNVPPPPFLKPTPKPIPATGSAPGDSFLP